MLIDFTVENYRSIKDPVTLSAVAQTSRGREQTPDGSRQRIIKPDNEIAKPHEVEGRSISLLPILALFGANASGKSNVIRALDELLDLIQFGSSTFIVKTSFN